MFKKKKTIFSKIKKNNFDLILFKLLIFFIYFSEVFFVDSTLPVYILIFIIFLINFRNINFNFTELIAICFIVLYVIYGLIEVDNTLVFLKNTKYYFSFLIFLLLIKYLNIDYFFLKKILLCICLYSFIDFILINLFNQSYFHQEEHATLFLNLFYRPFGFAGNSAVSSLIIIFTFYLLNNLIKISFSNLEKILVITSIIILMSITSYFVVLFLIIQEFFFKKKYLQIIFIIFVFIIIYFFVDLNLSERFTSDYFFYIISDKIKVLNLIISKFYHHPEYFDIEGCQFLIGCQKISYNPLTSSDSGLLFLFFTTGYFGLILFFFVSLSFLKFSKINFSIFIIILISCLHYAFIFQILAGSFLYTIYLTQKFNPVK